MEMLGLLQGAMILAQSIIIKMRNQIIWWVGLATLSTAY